MKKTLTAIVLLLMTAGTLHAETYTVDKNHSSATFSIRHLVSRVRGRFGDFAGTIDLDKAHLDASKVEFVIQAKSISTDNESRDNDLRSANFFEVDKYPTITFKSTKIVSAGKDKFEVTGEFTMHGVTKTITLPVTLMGFAPGQPERAGFEATTTLNRKDYGIIWNKALDAGGTLLGDDVDVTVNIEAKGPSPAPAAK
jgi:polyisoprenoid-binding protein YceI